MGLIPKKALKLSSLPSLELLSLKFVGLETKEDLPKDSSCSMVESMHSRLSQTDLESMKNISEAVCSIGLQIGRFDMDPKSC